MLTQLCMVNAQQKLKLEEDIKDFKRKYPDNNELLSIINEYKKIYSSCLTFDDDGTVDSVKTNEETTGVEGEGGSLSEDTQIVVKHQETKRKLIQEDENEAGNSENKNKEGTYIYV